ncbi:hypothetical protein WJX72_005105 [[Myrmecia] bisecta]|uniref:RWP-RK domain-containing protein n=1 Tax=[Myrmecia] bisecta TaxID=41462 RepID=A0AAW1Q778_9CHLO
MRQANDLQSRLQRAILTFNFQLAVDSRSGALTQAWLPQTALDGSVVLSTQGLPFTVAGGDLLALFRCMSCRYRFSTDCGRPASMDAVGRVYSSGECEMSSNVQRYDASVYLRVEDAKRCRVHACMFLPVYASADREHPLAVVEVAQPDLNVYFPAIFTTLQTCLEEVNLFTTDVARHAMAMGQLCRPPSLQSQRWQAGGRESAGGGPAEGQRRRQVTCSTVVVGVSKAVWARRRWHSQTPHANQQVNNRVGGGAGKRLSLQELEARYGLGLRDAAASLRICPTTLKRACRRHGITRWPRRQLAKMGRSRSSTLDQSQGTSGGSSEPLSFPHEPGTPASTGYASLAQTGLNGFDFRRAQSMPVQQQRMDTKAERVAAPPGGN